MYSYVQAVTDPPRFLYNEKLFNLHQTLIKDGINLGSIFLPLKVWATTYVILKQHQVLENQLSKESLCSV